jgi:hypothetical protein
MSRLRVLFRLQKKLGLQRKQLGLQKKQLCLQRKQLGLQGQQQWQQQLTNSPMLPTPLRSNLVLQQQQQLGHQLGLQLVEWLQGQLQWQQQLTNSSMLPTPLRSNLVLQQQQQLGHQLGLQLVEWLLWQQQWQQQLTNSPTRPTHLPRPTRPTPLGSNLELVLQQQRQLGLQLVEWLLGQQQQLWAAQT